MIWHVRYIATAKTPKGMDERLARIMSELASPKFPSEVQEAVSICATATREAFDVLLGLGMIQTI